jgi:hypothetical protein
LIYQVKSTEDLGASKKFRGGFVTLDVDERGDVIQ